jgi:hypothetical protein
VGLREKVKAEHMRATMSGFDDQGLGKAAPMDPPQDYAHGEANQEMHELVVTRMKREPNLSYVESLRARISRAGESLVEAAL